MSTTVASTQTASSGKVLGTVNSFVVFSCRLELQNLQLTHRAQRAESELSDLHAFLSQLLAVASPHAINHAVALPGPTSPAAALLTASSQAAATPAAMTQPAAAPASILPMDAHNQAAASPLLLSPSTAAAAAAPSLSMSQASGSSHGISQAGAAESSDTGQPQTFDPPSLLPDGQLKQLQCSDGQLQGCDGQIQSINGQLKSSNEQVHPPDGLTQSFNGQLQCSASPRKAGLPAVDSSSSHSMPDRSASVRTGLNSALSVDVTPTRSTSANGSPQQLSDIANQPLETAGHMRSGPSPSSGRPSGTMGRSSPPMCTSGRPSGTMGSSSPVVGTPIFCKPAGIALQPTRSQLKGKLGFLPVNPANQLPSLPPSSIQPADLSEHLLAMLEQSEHAFNPAQLKDNAVPMQRKEHDASSAVCNASPVQQADEAQQPAQVPSVSCKHSIPSKSHSQSKTTDCSTDQTQQASRGTCTPVMDRQTTAAAPSTASTEGISAVVATPSEDVLLGPVSVGKQNVARQQSGGLATLAAANNSKHLPAASRPPSSPGGPPEGCRPEIDAPAPCVLTGLDKADADLPRQAGTDAHKPADQSVGTMPTSIARVLRHHSYEHTSCTHSMKAEAGTQAPSVAAAAGVKGEAGDTDTLTHATDTPAESAAVAGSFSSAAEGSPSNAENASQKVISHTAAELFCMVSDRDSQDVANSQNVASQSTPNQGFPPESKSLQLDACGHQLQHLIQCAYHDQQLAPAVSQHQEPLTASPQQLNTEHSFDSVAVLSLPGLPLHQQDAQEFAEAARPPVDRVDPGEHHEKVRGALVNDGTAAVHSDANEKENRQAVESAMASGDEQ